MAVFNTSKAKDGLLFPTPRPVFAFHPGVSASLAQLNNSSDHNRTYRPKETKSTPSQVPVCHRTGLWRGD